MAEKPILLGIDLGTQQLKVIAVDSRDARMLGSVQTPVEVVSSSPGMLEQAPEAWWDSLRRLIPQLLADCRIDAADVGGIGLSGHMHSVISLGKDGTPVHNAITWADSRSAAQAGLIAALDDVELWNPSIAAYSAPKILWLREHYPEQYAQVRCFLYPKDYLRYRLTGRVATDYSDASGSLLWDFQRRTWDTGLMARLGLNPDCFPPVQSADDVGGTLTEAAAKTLGLAAGMPVAVGAGDVANAVIGAGLTASNSLLVNAGTAAQLILVRDQVQPYRRGGPARYLFELGVEGRTFVMGALPGSGLSLEWWRKIIGPQWSYQELDALAGDALSAPDDPFFIPYLQGTGTPHLRDDSMGTFTQMSATTSPRDLTRAVMEGIVFGIKYGVDALLAGQSLSGVHVQITGGVTKSTVMRRLFGLSFGPEMSFRKFADVSALGAVMLAARATDQAASLQAALSQMQAESQPPSEDPQLEAVVRQRYARYRRWVEAVMAVR